jgi:hypothetical protein
MTIGTKVISLSASPFRASQLCFEVGGILGESNVELGAKVRAFDFAAFYVNLGSLETFPNRPANLLYDFLEIQAAVKPFTLAALRAESAKAALHKAVNARANAYFAKYANIPDVISKMNEYYDPNNPGSKTRRLEILRSISEQQVQKLRDAYQEDHRTGAASFVVKNTESNISISSGSKETSISSEGTFSEQPDIRFIPALRMREGGAWSDAYPGAAWLDSLALVSVHANQHSATVPTQEGEFQVDKKFQSSIVESRGDITQKAINRDYVYRIPYLESAAQYHRAQVSLMDEQFAQFMSRQNLPYLNEFLQNELNSIDMDVFQLQIAYLNTILMSPIAGIVTGVYKYPGDAVTPGEPVFRVEEFEYFPCCLAGAPWPDLGRFNPDGSNSAVRCSWVTTNTDDR